MTDPCQCGLTPEVKEIRSVTYVAVCPCGNHGPAMQLKQWAESEWNEKLRQDEKARKTAKAA